MKDQEGIGELGYGFGTEEEADFQRLLEASLRLNYANGRSMICRVCFSSGSAESDQ